MINFREPKRSSAPPAQAVKEGIILPDPASTKPEGIYQEIGQRDTDSDFAEIKPLDDVDVSDQLTRKKEVKQSFICVVKMNNF